MFAALPSKATVVEVGPRDGLQSEPEVVETSAKIALIDQLATAGYRHIEITSFVNPRWVPQLADAMEVARSVKRHPGVIFSALVPNLRALARHTFHGQPWTLWRCHSALHAFFSKLWQMRNSGNSSKESMRC